jgi:hypothetical protein
MMFVRHRRSECIAVFEFSRPRHLSETSMSPLLLVLSIIASQTPPVPSGTIAPIDQTQCAFITALAQWESQCRDGVARAFLVDSDSTVQRSTITSRPRKVMPIQAASSARRAEICDGPRLLGTQRHGASLIQASLA